MASVTAYADAAENKPLSMTTARVLSFIPLNSPAKFYTRHPIQGSIFTPVEAFGLFLLIGGAVEKATENRDDFNFNDVAMIIGGVTWFAPWLYTVLSTPGDVRSYNEKLARPKGLAFQPALQILDDGLAFGFHGRF